MIKSKTVANGNAQRDDAGKVSDLHKQSKTQLRMQNISHDTFVFVVLKAAG
jgi:hypothetical protein